MCHLPVFRLEVRICACSQAAGKARRALSSNNSPLNSCANWGSDIFPPTTVPPHWTMVRQGGRHRHRSNVTSLLALIWQRHLLALFLASLTKISARRLGRRLGGARSVHSCKARAPPAAFRQFRCGQPCREDIEMRSAQSEAVLTLILSRSRDTKSSLVSSRGCSGAEGLEPTGMCVTDAQCLESEL